MDLHSNFFLDPQFQENESMDICQGEKDSDQQKRWTTYYTTEFLTP